MQCPSKRKRAERPTVPSSKGNRGAIDRNRHRVVLAAVEMVFVLRVRSRRGRRGGGGGYEHMEGVGREKRVREQERALADEWFLKMSQFVTEYSWTLGLYQLFEPRVSSPFDGCLLNLDSRSPRSFCFMALRHLQGDALRGCCSSRHQSLITFRSVHHMPSPMPCSPYTTHPLWIPTSSIRNTCGLFLVFPVSLNFHCG